MLAYNRFTSSLFVMVLALLPTGQALAQKVAPKPLPYPTWRLESKGGKTNVCSITINSSEEIETFKRKLGTKNFNYIELTTIGAEEAKPEDNLGEDYDNLEWFQKACRKKISCDILIISGHFGGSFFGSSEYSLSMEELEKSACDNSCDAILQNPKEVFLFGCNTLAGKNQDHRTPEEYRRVLMEDGFSAEDAEQVVAFRYSPMGDSFFDRMQRVFRGAPRIYGFDSVAPSGTSIQGALANYFDLQTRTYYFPENLKTLDESINEPLAKALRWMSLAQAKGAKDIVREQIPVCFLNNEEVPFFKKLNWVEKSLNSEKSFAYLPAINDWLASLEEAEHKWRDKEFEMLESVMRNTKLRDSLENIIKRRDSSILGMQLKILTFMKFFGWVHKKDYIVKVQNLLLGDLNQEMDIETKDRICSYAYENSLKINIDADSIPEDRYKDSYFIEALSCVASFNHSLMNRAIKEMSSPDVDPYLSLSFGSLLYSLEIPQSTYEAFYKEMFPQGDQILTSVQKEFLCNQYGAAVPLLKTNSLAPALKNNPDYIENTGCYLEFNNTIVNEIIELSQQPNLKYAVDASMEALVTHHPYPLKLEKETQLKFYKFLKGLDPTRITEPLSMLGRIENPSTELISLLVEEYSIAPGQPISKHLYLSEEKRLESLGKNLYCEMTYARAEKAVSSDVVLTLFYLENIASRCQVDDDYNKLPESDKARFKSVVMKVLNKPMVSSSILNNTGLKLSDLPSLIVGENLSLENVYQLRNLIEINRSSTSSIGGYDTGNYGIVNLLSNVRLELGLEELYRSNTSVDNYTFSIILTAEKPYSFRDGKEERYERKLEQLALKKFKTNDLTVENEIEALFTQDSKLGAKYWIKAVNQFASRVDFKTDFMIKALGSNYTFPFEVTDLSQAYKTGELNEAGLFKAIEILSNNYQYRSYEETIQLLKMVEIEFPTGEIKKAVSDGIGTLMKLKECDDNYSCGEEETTVSEELAAEEEEFI